MDRKILYGTERLLQPPSNLPLYVDFPGHDVDSTPQFMRQAANAELISNMVLNHFKSWHNNGYTTWVTFPEVEDGTHSNLRLFSTQDISQFRVAAADEGEGERSDQILNALNDAVAGNPDSERRSEAIAAVQAVLIERRQRDRGINEQFLAGIQAALGEHESLHPDPREPMDEERSWELVLHGWAEDAVQEASYRADPEERADFLVEELEDFVGGHPERRNQAIAAIKAALAERVHREAEALDGVHATEPELPPPELASLFDGTDETFEELPDEVVEEHDADRERWAC